MLTNWKHCLCYQAGWWFAWTAVCCSCIPQHQNCS